MDVSQRVLWSLVAALGLGLPPVLGVAAENLVVNGGFELVDATDERRPAGWELPDGLGVQWVDAPDGGRGRCIRLDTQVSERAMVAQWRAMGIEDWDIPDPADHPVAETYGLSFYSAAMPLLPEQAYRLRFRFQGPGGGKVWVRCYAEKRGRMVRLYEAVANASSPENWKDFSHAFHPTRHRPQVTEMKVMLYAFHPAGSYHFDDVVIEAIDAATYERERSTLER